MPLQADGTAIVHPTLPKSLLQKLRADPRTLADNSIIFTEQFAPYRIAVLGHGTSPEVAVVDPADSRTVETLGIDPVAFSRVATMLDRTFSADDKKTWLHWAATRADLHLAYEAIRLGVGVNYRDQAGSTPLSTVCTQIAHNVALIGRLPPEDFILYSTPALSMPNFLWRLTRIAILLIEQRADVQACNSGGETPLVLACRAKNFDLIECLLQHGADPSILTSSQLKQNFPDSSDLRKYHVLVRTKASSKRPPQPCPCWSGKLLADCHAAGPQPYPSYYLCRCGTNKTYAKCCAKRSINITEEWQASEQYLLSRTSIRTSGFSIDPDLLDTFSDFVDFMKKSTDQDRALDAELGLACLRQKMNILNDLIRTGRGSPAFLFAARDLQFIALPFGDTSPRARRQDLMDTWNAAVDKYIASTSAGAKRVEIEREAKVGVDGGPLFKYCQGVGCGQVEDVAGVKLKCCGQCRRTFYCSATCQVAAWSTHKYSCKSEHGLLSDHQMLPTQKLYIEEMRRVSGECMRRIREMGDFNEALKGSLMDAGGVILLMRNTLDTWRVRPGDRTDHESRTFPRGYFEWVNTEG
ncbi:uncharacterized protein FIBRA_06436 [Fibroporia radiculosa]|uniref:MYND-type domain-containing protein n=1 Tax=Fibroporia radiculosa TaxID=599839 RepID=J4HZ39_9APHY|nr:uncharacterized protein FIBRA_06436 [Fibroporia radiculosa]CCM04267.1 predicted protein [Fibroporia radiculosa]